MPGAHGMYGMYGKCVRGFVGADESRTAHSASREPPTKPTSEKMSVESLKTFSSRRRSPRSADAWMSMMHQPPGAIRKQRERGSSGNKRPSSAQRGRGPEDSSFTAVA